MYATCAHAIVQHQSISGAGIQPFGRNVSPPVDFDPPGLFEDGPPERRTIKIKKDQAVDYAQLGVLLGSAASTIHV